MTAATRSRARLPWVASVLAGWLLVAGCAGTQSQARKPPIPPPSVTGKPDCVDVRSVQNFLVLDRSNLIVYAPNEANAYHVRISPPSSDLPWADDLVLIPSGSQLCGYAGDRLLVDGERYAVIDVARLSPEGLQSLRAGQRGESLPVPKPEPGPGAEIEHENNPAAPAPPEDDSQSGSGTK